MTATIERPDAGRLLRDSFRTENRAAVEFIDCHSAEVRYVSAWGRWLAWDGKRWKDDANSVHVMRLARKHGAGYWQEFADLAKRDDVEAKELLPVRSFIRRLNSASGITAMLSLARADSRVAVSVDELNEWPNILNIANGTIDLNTGGLRPHDPGDLLTQLAPVEYIATAECPQWLATLDLIFAGNRELIRFVKKLLGYSTTGDTGEHILPICSGTGCNGKSTVWNAVTALLGDYAALAPESLLLGDGSNHPTDRAILFGKRFVAISEPERGAKLREARVKELTGDGTITARRMREDFWEFRRTHTFWLSTNHLPRIDGGDEGIWRRVKLIPFSVDLRQVTTPKPDFDKWLVKHEGPGILRWLVEGYQLYLAEGLGEPATVQVATGHYRTDCDPLADWLDECCACHPEAESTSANLFASYVHWGGKWSQTYWGRVMAERFEKDKPTAGEFRRKVIYRGVELVAPGESHFAERNGSVTPVVTSQNVNTTEKRFS